MRTLDKLTGVRALLAVIALALAAIALRPGLALTPTLAAQPAGGRFDVTALGISRLGYQLVLDNASGEIWELQTVDGDEHKAGHVELWGRMTKLGEPIKLAPARATTAPTRNPTSRE